MLPIQHSMLGHHRPAQRNTIWIMAFRWRAVDGPLIVVFGSFLSSSIKKKKQKKNVVKVGPLWQNFLDPRMLCKDSLVLVLVTRQNWQPSRHTTLTQHWFNVIQQTGSELTTIPQKGDSLKDLPSYPMSSNKWWSRGTGRCCAVVVVFFFVFLFFFPLFSLRGVVSVFFVCFVFDLVAAVHRASLSPQQQNTCWQRWFRSDESTQ